MATDIEKLVVQLSADIKGFEKQLAKANGVSNKQFNAVERRARQMNKNLDGIFARSFRGLTAPVAGIGAALGTREIARYADAWTTAGNKIAAASQVAGRQGRSLIELNDIARSTRSGISETADLYAKLLRSTAGVAKSELEVAKATETVNKAFKAGGAAASEQAAGILQLAQGLGSGLLQGDELRSVRENAPLLAQAIADYFGTTVAGLKELGSQGKLTSEEIFKAILSGQAKIEGAFKATNSTIAEGFTMVSNAMIQYVGTSDASLGVTSQLVAGLTILADNFGSVADGALQVATVIAGALIGRSLIGMIRTLGLTGTALISFTRALRAASSAGALMSAFGGLSAAAGPLGMLIGGALVLSVGSYAKASWDAAKNSDALKAEMQQLGLYSSKAAKSLDETAESLDKLTAADKVRKLKQINDELDRLRNGGGGLFSREDELSNIAASARSPLRSIAGQFTVSDADKAARREIAKMAEDFAVFNIKADEVKRRLEAINDTNVSMGVIELGERLRETLDLVAANEAFSTRYGDTLTESISRVGEEIQSLKAYYKEAADAEIISQKQYGELSKLVDEFSKTGNGAEALRKSIQDIEKAAPNLNWLTGEFDRLIQKMGVVISTAQAAGRALSLASPLGPDENKQARAAADPYIVQRKVENELSATFEKNALRKASLKKDELAMENKLVEVRKRLIDEGVANPSKDMIDRISRAELAGDASRSAEGRKPKKEKKERDNDYERLTKSIADRTASMVAETEVQRQLNPLIDDYGYAVEKARAEQELLNAAQKAGVEVTPALRAEIGATAEQFAIATVEAGKLAEAQDKIRQNAEEMADFQKDLTRGMVDGFIQGKKAADIFADALTKIGNKLLDMAFDGLFDTKSGGGIGSIFKMLGFADGGYTGSGGVNQPAGVVHKGEVVWSQKDVARGGGVAAVEAMRRGVRGYATGGPVAIPTPPRMPVLKAPSAQSGGINMTFAPVIDARGADQAAVDRLQRGLEKTNREMEARVIQTVRQLGPKNIK